MNLARELVGDVVVVTVQEEYLDVRNFEEFRRCLASLLGRDLNVVLQMEQVLLVDSSFFGVIIACLRRIRAAGGEMRLCALTRAVRAFVELVRLHKVVDIFNTRDEAVRAFEV